MSTYEFNTTTENNESFMSNFSISVEADCQIGFWTKNVLLEPANTPNMGNQPQTKIT